MYVFSDETAAGLLGQGESCCPQLSLGVTRTVSSENPWDLAPLVTGMAPSMGVFFQAASPQPCVADHVQKDCGSAYRTIANVLLGGVHPCSGSGWLGAKPEAAH